MSYQIFVHKIPLHLHIGLDEKERFEKQIVMMDIECTPKRDQAGQSDAIEDTLNYHAFTLFLKEHAESTSFKLLEALAEHLLSLVKNNAHFPIQSLTIKLTKSGVFDEAETYGIVMTRHYG